MKGRLAIATIAGTLALPTGALAKSTTYAPPGNSGVDQYLETVPTGGGGHATSGPASTGGGGGGGGGSNPSGGASATSSALSAGTAKRLAAQGAAGRAVKRLVKQTAPPRSPAANPNGAQGRGAVSAALHPLVSHSGDGGVGILLPLFLGATLLVTVAVVLRRRFAGGGGAWPRGPLSSGE